MNLVKISVGKVYPLILMLLLAIYVEMNIGNIITTLFPANANLIKSIWIINIIIAILILLTIKFCMSFLNGIAAIIMDNNGITDNIRNVRILWKDVKDINIVFGKSTSNIVITLTNHTTHTINLFFVSGKGDDIYNKIKNYYQQLS